MKRKRFPKDVFVKKNSPFEEKYLKKHHLNLSRLENGAIILGLAKRVSDMTHTEINLNFPQGAYLDPIGKEGTTHLLEHMLNPTLREKANHLDVSLNASTSSVLVTETIRGIANPKYKTFGVWPILDELRDAIEYPLRKIQNLDERFETEKKVVLAEISERHSNHDYWVWKNIRTDVFAKTNPENVEVVGTPDSLNSITIKDLQKKEKQILISTGLIIDILSEGAWNIGNKLSTEFANLFSTFRIGKLPDLKTIWEKRERINKSFREGKIYIHPTYLNNGLVTISYLWVFDRIPYTPSSFALWRMKPYLEDRIFRSLREKGLSYTSYMDVWTPEEIKTLFSININIPKSSYKNNIYPYIKSNALNLNSEDAAKICDIEEKRRKSRPMYASDVLHWAYSGLRQYGEMVDADTIANIYGQIRPRHIIEWCKKINSIKPAVIITGDLE